MKKNFLAFAPYLIALGINFYILPLWANDTGSAVGNAFHKKESGV